MNRGYQILTNAARGILLTVLAVGPWMMGGRSPSVWFWLFAGVWTSTLLWGLATVFDRGRLATASFLTPVMIPILLWLAWGTVQLAPLSREVRFDHAVLADWQPPVTVSPWNLDPSRGRLEVARYLCAAMVFVLGVNLFRTPESRRLLFAVIAVSGLSLGVFGIIQKMTWNEKLYWTFPLRNGGVPFASYVNRNHAAGLLNMAVACVAGLAVFEARAWRSRKSAKAVWPEPGAVPQIPMFCFAAGALLIVSVAATLSRGGILAMGAGVTMAVLASSRELKFQGMVGILGVSVVAVIAVGWLGFQRALESRLETISGGTVLQESRLEHWKDTWGAVQDSPIVGSGLGSYRWVNRPYQRSDFGVWFANADNQYFEWLVETGWIGIAILLSGIGLALYYLRQLRSIPDSRDLFTCGLMVLIAVGLQAATDYGISVVPNLLLLAVIVGSVCGTAVLGRYEEMSKKGRVLVVPPAPWIGRTAAVLFLGLGGWGLSEAFSAGPAYDLGERTEWALDQLDGLTDHELNVARKSAEEMLRKRPDDADLHRLAAELWIYRYRKQAYKQLLEENPESGTNWYATILPTLQSNVVAGGEPAAARILALDVVQNNLIPAAKHLQLSSQCCPWIMGVDAPLATLRFITKESPEQFDVRLRRAAFLTPSDPAVQYELGCIARTEERYAICERCWRQCLKYTNRWFDPIIRAAGEWMGTVDLVSTLTPDSEAQAILFAERLPLEWRSEILFRRLEELLHSAEPSQTPGERLQWLGRMARLRGDEGKALELFQQAVREQPFEVDWRVTFAELLEKSGRTDEAVAQLDTAHQYAPMRGDISNRLQLIHQKRGRKSR